jgi:ubiquitin carboxyl-terminal hydrolase 1
MSLLPDEFRAWCIEILSSPAFIQVVPFVIIVTVPTVFYCLATRANPRRLFYKLAMVFDSLGISIPWGWSSGSSSLSASFGRNVADKKKLRKGVRTRAEQMAALNGTAKHGT